MRKGEIICIVAALTAASVSCRKADDRSVEKSVRVKVEAATQADISASQVYSGTVEASSGTALSFPVSGTVRTVTVGEGDRVAKGQLVASLDQSTLINAYEIARATLDQAQDAYNRMKMLHDSNSLPDMQWVEVQNALKQAQSAEAIAKKALGDANLYAPVSGYVSERFVEPGMTVAPIEPIVKIVDINPVKISISVPESDISGISEGQTAKVHVGSLGEGDFTGTVTEKGVSANALSRAYDVKITVDNPDNALLPGMICDVTLQNAAPRQALVLPMQAVLLDADNSNFVWIDSAGLAAKRIVSVSGMTDAGIVVSSGISPGDSVIVEGQQKVSQGTPVVPVE